MFVPLHFQFRTSMEFAFVFRLFKFCAPSNLSSSRPWLFFFSFGPQEVNEVAAELCEHITLFGVPQANKPSAVVACVPTAMKVLKLGGQGRAAGV